MSAYCRICASRRDKRAKDGVPSYVACKNCGSFACKHHYVWYDTSKNAFCTICFPKQLASSTRDAASGLQAMIEGTDVEIPGYLIQRIEKICKESHDLTITELIELLKRIIKEIIHQEEEQNNKT